MTVFLYVPGLPRTESANRLKMFIILPLTRHFYLTVLRQLGLFQFRKWPYFKNFFLVQPFRWSYISRKRWVQIVFLSCSNVYLILIKKIHIFRLWALQHRRVKNEMIFLYLNSPALVLSRNGKWKSPNRFVFLDPKPQKPILIHHDVYLQRATSFDFVQSFSPSYI